MVNIWGGRLIAFVSLQALELVMPDQDNNDDCGLANNLRVALLAYRPILVERLAGRSETRIPAAMNVSEELIAASNSAVIRAVFLAVGEALTALNRLDLGEASTRLERGSAWTSLAVASLRLLVPRTPVDPAAQTAVRCELLEQRLRNLESLLELNALDDILGTSTSSGISASQAEVARLRAQLDELRRTLPRRPNQIVLGEMFRDLASFSADFLGFADDSSSRILSLRNHLLTGGRDRNMALDEEVVMQDMLQSAVQRLSTRYQDCRDMIDPICSRIFWVKHGLSLIRSGSEQARCADVFPLANNSLRYPFKLSQTVSDRMRLEDHLSTHEVEQWASHDIMEASLVRLATCTTILGDKAFAVAQKMFNTIARREVEAQKKALEERAEPTSIYRYKDAGRDSAEENELLERFPDYSADVQTSQEVWELDTTENSNADAPRSLAARAGRDRLSTPKAGQRSDCWRIMTLHRTIVDTVTGILHPVSNVSHPLKAGISQEDAFVNGAQAFAVWYQANISAASSTCELDETCFVGMLRLLHGLSKEFSGGEGAKSAIAKALGEPANFYTDPDVREAAHALQPLSSLSDRISRLLESWPEHEVLLEISRVCDRVSSFPASSPIMKWLTGFELLLRKCDDWESYASRDVTLKPEIEALTATIVRWRKMELESWKELLLWEEHKSEQATSKLWPHLFTSIANWDIGDNDEAAVPSLEELRNLVGTLDQFILSASAGEVACRLKMLDTFGKHLRLAADLGFKANLASTIGVLDNVTGYYGGLVRYATKYVGDQKRSIDKELRDYTRIASWKDVSVYALRESAARTHHHLFKFVKRYREVLDTPIAVLLQQYVQSRELGDPSVVHTKPLAVAVNAMSDERRGINDDDIARLLAFQPSLADSRLADAKRLIVRMGSVGREVASALKTGLGSQGFDELAVDIIETTATFAKEADSAGDVDGPHRSNMKAVRRKALVDLLRRLQKLGLSPRSLPASSGLDLVTTLTSLRPINFQSDPWSSADRYFFAVLSGVSKMRDLMGRRSHDLSDSEAARCLNYIENLLAMLRQQRSHLALTDALLHKLRALGRGLFKSPDIGGMDVWVSPSSLMLMHDAMSLVRDIEGFCDQFRELAKSHPDRFSQLAGIFELDCPTVLTELATVLAPLDSDTKAGILVTDRGLRAADQAADLAVNFIEKCHAAAGSDAINAAVYLDAAKEIETDLKRVRAGTAGIGPVPGDVSETSGAVGLLAHEAFRAIDEMLVGYQGALASATDLGASMKSGSEGLEGPDLDEYGLRPRQVAITDSVFANWHTKCKLDRVGQACETLKGALCALGDVEPTSTTAKEIGAIIKCTAGLFAAYFDDADRFAHELLVAHKTLAKLAHVLCQTFSGLFERGFCVPEPEKETKAEDEEKGQGGAGLGEGTGESNVSNQVEHEDELEGARDESGRQKGSESGPQEQRGNDGDDTVSMGEEFEGQLADVPQDQGEEGDDGEQNEADEQMGRVDGQGRQEVDNELWNKEDAKEEETGEAESGDLDENEETDDHGQEPPANLKNAREEAQKEDSKPSEDTADSADAGQQDNPQEAKYESELVAKQGEGEERDEVPDAREDAERERESRNEVNAQADENKSDGEGSEDQESGDRNDDVDIAEERTSEAGDAELQDAPHLVPDEGMNDEQEGSAELPDAMDLEGGDSDRDDLQEEADGVDAEMDDAVQQDHGEEAAAQDRAADVEMEAAEAQDDEGQGQAPEAGGQEGQDRHTKETVAQDRAGSTSQPGGDVRDRQSERAQEGPQPRRKMDLPDPSRSLGDAKKAWQRRLNMIDEGQKDNSAPDEAAGEDVQDADMFEHVPEGTESASKTQNLGAVQDEDSNVKVDGTEEQSADRTALEEEGRRDVAEMEPQLDALGEESVIQAENEPQSSSGGYRGGEIRDARADNVEMRAGTTGASTAAEGAVDESQQPLEPDGEDPIKTYEQLREEMDKLARGEEEADWHARETARKLWSQYENRTRHLSAALGEQLRLILEPTLAAQLKGDYKSGKRLNMRKIIPYIASSFKKDKIWLRRTRPSKRQYQIMIAVDDSKSMSESRSVQLTYESVAIMAKALSSIEAGELGVVRFGEDVKLLHDFESPFGSESGASVISQFTFNQTRTDVKLLLQHALGMFSAARDSAASRGQSGALDLWQLLVVMSDGIYEEHATVRSLIQQAAEQRIFVLFVVIDNRLERDSVLSMTNVNYVYVDGKPNLSFTRYMDTFPAEFYVVLRNIEALPSVLSSALKQFFSASTGV